MPALCRHGTLPGKCDLMQPGEPSHCIGFPGQRAGRKCIVHWEVGLVVFAHAKSPLYRDGGLISLNVDSRKKVCPGEGPHAHGQDAPYTNSE